MLLTFSLTVLAWVFFRANNIEHAISYLMGIFTAPFFSFPPKVFSQETFISLFLLLIFIIVEWIGREGQYALFYLDKIKYKYGRWIIYIIIVFSIIIFSGSNQTFIYFQF